MSEMERNKGKLIPIEFTEEMAKQLVSDKEELLDDYKTYKDKVRADPSWYTEDIMFVGDKTYKVVWEVKWGDGYDGFADVKVNNDGSIDFHTYHYNGGAFWTEVIEHELGKDYFKGETKLPEKLIAKFKVGDTILFKASEDNPYGHCWEGEGFNSIVLGIDDNDGNAKELAYIISDGEFSQLVHPDEVFPVNTPQT